MHLLHELDKTKYTKDLVKHLASLDIENGSEILAGNLAVEIGRYDYAIQIAKQASYEKRFYNKLNYPVIQIPNIVNQKTMPKSELVLAVIRQESERSEEHTSELQSRTNLVCRLLLEKKNKCHYPVTFPTPQKPHV